MCRLSTKKIESKLTSTLSLCQVIPCSASFWLNVLPLSPDQHRTKQLSPLYYTGSSKGNRTLGKTDVLSSFSKKLAARKTSDCGSIPSTSAKRSGGLWGAEAKPMLDFYLSPKSASLLVHFLYILHFQASPSKLILPERGI